MNKRWLAAVAAVALASGCITTPVRTKRNEAPKVVEATDVERIAKDAAHRAEVSASSFEHHQNPDFMLGFIEFDDQGWMWNDRQFDTVKAEFEERLIRKNGASVVTEPAIIVLFVHGWRHSVDACDRDVTCFREVLRGLAYYEKERAAACVSNPEKGRDPRNCVQRHIAGVMLGWKGAPFLTRNPFLDKTVEKGNILSFYSRKNAAHQIGGAGHVASVVGWLRTLDRQLSADNHRSRLVMAGHSFGAAMLFSAVSGVINEEVAEARFRPRVAPETDCETFDVDGIGDLVVLINPAFEALRYHSVHARTHDLKRCPRGGNLLVTIAAKNDVYNRFWFTFGRTFSTITDSFTSATAQHSAAVRALGHYEPFRTHELARNRDLTHVPVIFEERKDRKDHACACRYTASEAQVQELVKGIFGGPSAKDPLAQMAPRTAAGSPDCDTPSCLKAVGEVDEYNPVKVIWTDPEILDGHSDIYNPLLIDFLVRSVATSDRAGETPRSVMRSP